MGFPCKNIPARGFLGFVRERPRAQRSISADLIFLVLFVSRQNCEAFMNAFKKTNSL